MTRQPTDTNRLSIAVHSMELETGSLKMDCRVRACLRFMQAV